MVLLPLSQILLTQVQKHTRNNSVIIPFAVIDGSVP